MTLIIAAEPAPLETNVDGVVQVGKTRVTLFTKTPQVQAV